MQTLWYGSASGKWQWIWFRTFVPQDLSFIQKVQNCANKGSTFHALLISGGFIHTGFYFQRHMLTWESTDLRLCNKKPLFPFSLLGTVPQIALHSLTSRMTVAHSHTSFTSLMGRRTVLLAPNVAEVEVKAHHCYGLSGDNPSLSFPLHFAVNLGWGCFPCLQLFPPLPGKVGVFLDLLNGLFISSKF